VTEATKNPSKGNYNAPNDIPHGFLDSDAKQIVKIPKKLKKSRNYKNKRKQKKNFGKQATGSNEATGGSKRDHEGNQQDQPKLCANSSNSGNNNTLVPSESYNLRI